MLVTDMHHHRDATAISPRFTFYENPPVSFFFSRNETFQDCVWENRHVRFPSRGSAVTSNWQTQCEGNATLESTIFSQTLNSTDFRLIDARDWKVLAEAVKIFRLNFGSWHILSVLYEMASGRSKRQTCSTNLRWQPIADRNEWPKTFRFGTRRG